MLGAILGGKIKEKSHIKFVTIEFSEKSQPSHVGRSLGSNECCKSCLSQEDIKPIYIYIYF